MFGAAIGRQLSAGTVHFMLWLPTLMGPEASHVTFSYQWVGSCMVYYQTPVDL